MPAELSSPAVAFLAHESCPVSGECIDSAGGEVWRTFIARTQGISDRAHGIETIAAQWDRIMSEAGAETIGIGGFDTSTWKIRPYEGVQ